MKIEVKYSTSMIDWNKTIRIMGDAALVSLHKHTTYEMDRQLKCRTCPRVVNLDRQHIDTDDYVYQEYREKDL